MVPAFVVQLLYYFKSGEERDRLIALLIFAVASILDGVDGYIARRYNQKSILGAVLDPLADKFMLVSAMLLLSLYEQPHAERIPTWLTAVVVSRDFILIMGMAIVYYTCGKLTPSPRFIGKISTVLQMLVALWTMLKWGKSGIECLAFIAAVATAISGLMNIRDGMKQLSQSPLSSPDQHL